MSRPLSAPERVAWARLARTVHIGPVTFDRLMTRFGSPSAVLEALPKLAHGRFEAPSAAAIEDEIAKLSAMNARLIASCEDDYPALLRALDPGPALIAVRGDAAWLHKPTVAIVGARDASAVGLTLAKTFAHDLGAMGFVIVSGLARGVDAQAHAAALDTGTVAVIAGGLDKPYPPQNIALYEAIAERGCVVAEAPLGFQARARDFPRRNHLISGLSRGVVVIEAAVRSGSLITAHAAADQGREVLAVPGSPLDHRFRGANALIKAGATLVENAEDVAAALGASPTGGIAPRRPSPPLGSDADPPPPGLAGVVARLLSPTPMHLNELARLSAAPLGAVSAVVMELELEGRAASLPGGYVAVGSSAFGAV